LCWLSVCCQLSELQDVNASLTRQTERLSSVERENTTLKSRLTTLEQQPRQQTNGPVDHGQTLAHTHTHPFNGPLSGTTWSTTTRSTQPCIPPGSLNRVPASAGVRAGTVTSARWQVTLCDPMWHVSSRSGVATLRTAIHLLVS